MRDRFLAACVQMRVTDDKERNRQVATRRTEDAAKRGARLVALPEMFFWRGRGGLEQEMAEELDGPTIQSFRALAARLGITLVAGSILESDPAGGRPFNTCVVLGEDGSILGRYRKIHLFDVSIPGGVSVLESERFAAGAEVVCVDTAVGRIGLSICYDLRFPELYRRLIEARAELICAPSAFTFATGAAHWDVLLRARAIESQCHLVAPNQTGPTEHGPNVFGHSSVIDPWGTVLARAPDGEGAVVAEIDPVRQADVRRQLPALEHRRLAT